MRTTIASLALVLGLAGNALAQGNQGAFAIDGMFAPTTRLGFGYYVTDGLSLRPWVGVGYSDYQGFFANVGTQLRFEFAPDSELSPYLSGVAQYTHNGAAPVAAPAGQTGAGGAYQPVAIQSNYGELGAGAGVRYRISRSVSAFGEARVVHATAPYGSYGSGWSTIAVNDQTRAQVVLGVTYLFR
jgi:hypothetical protein